MVSISTIIGALLVLVIGFVIGFILGYLYIESYHDEEIDKLNNFYIKLLEEDMEERYKNESNQKKW